MDDKLRRETAQVLHELWNDVKRDRDRLAAAKSLTLRFVWQPRKHTYQGQLWWQHGYYEFAWADAGTFFGNENLPTEDKGETYPCQIYLVGEDEACIAFMRHSRETVAILERVSGGRAKNLNWAEWLFSSCADELAWDDNEEPGRPETWSQVAELTDVLDWTGKRIKLLLDTMPKKRVVGTKEERLRALNERAMQAGMLDSDFKNKPTVRKWAERLDCAEGMVGKLPFYIVCSETAGTRKKGKPLKPDVFSLDAVADNGDHDKELKRLIGEQRRDDEPSPLEADAPGRPRKVRCPKML